MSNSSSNNTPSSSSKDSTSGGNGAVGITSIIVGGVVIIVIATSIIKCAQKAKKRSRHSSLHTTSAPTSGQPLTSFVGNGPQIEMASIEIFLDDVLNEKPSRFSPQHLMAFTTNYALRLGSGGFGVVYKGQLPNGVHVAVKVLHKTHDRRAEEQFMAEVGTMGRTYHINLVRLYGFCFDAMIKALVYEYMENGSLDRYLFNERRRLERSKLHLIAIGTAKGIRYLHEECQKKIIHYDIKPANILLDANFCPKVADFGLAKLCDKEDTHVTITGGRGTPGYAAPELWTPFPVTHKCDVYSFGMLLFEILGRRRNLDVGQTSSREWFPRWVWEKFERQELESIMAFCGIETKDREKAETMCKVALWCVQYLPEARPSMSVVVRMLEGELEVTLPVNPFQHLGGHGSGSDSSSHGTKESTSKGNAISEG